MDRDEVLSVLTEGRVDEWNDWKVNRPEIPSLDEADLRGARLHGAQLEEVDLCGADFRGADLREVGFRGAFLSGANLSQAEGAVP
jgi:uncharacterized protein YjbI with pentapeptide repeats